MEEIRRKKARFQGGDEAGEGLWAISYADLLMVMMSFFIVFFNIEDTNTGPTTKYQGIIVSLTEGNILKKDPESGKVFKGQVIASKGKKSFFSKGFSETDVDQKLSFEESSDHEVRESIYFTTLQDSPEIRARMSKGQISDLDQGIVIDFTDNIFNLGDFELTDKSKNELEKVLKNIKGYKDHINLVFIGHADSAPMAQNRKVVKSNLILSSLRASSAVEYAIAQGFDPLWVSAQGMGEFSRGSRTISLRVVMR